MGQAQRRYPSSTITGKSMTTIILTPADASPWQKPSDWNDADNSVTCIGAGGGGLAGGSGRFTRYGGGGHAGGGGAIGIRTNVDLSTVTEVAFQIGVGGVGGASGQQPGSGTPTTKFLSPDQVWADPGHAGGAGGGLGGDDINGSVGDFVAEGGRGGNGVPLGSSTQAGGGGGGGGAGLPTGNGNGGGHAPPGVTGLGGAGDGINSGSGGDGGAPGLTPNAAGGPGANGGSYGAGGGGGGGGGIGNGQGGNGGAGADGCIVITWNPA